MSERPKKVWEITNVLPIIEVQTATSEQLAKLREVREQGRKATSYYQSIAEKPISEVFPETKKQEPQG